MPTLFQQRSPLRIFAFSTVASFVILAAVMFGSGPAALLTTLLLAVVEITFSFDNAIINAKVLGKVARPWQVVFLSVGIIIAIFGMRLLFPVLIVSLTAHLGFGQVVGLALHHPAAYAQHLQQAHASIAAFGGAFLLMLGLTFFFDDEREVHWLRPLERQAKRFSHWSVAPLVSGLVIATVALVPANSHTAETLVAGVLGAATYALLQSLSALLARLQARRGTSASGPQTGLAAVASLLYLEVLDASFSFDGVIGAFAITSSVVLIAAGLGIGALWVRSLTVFMVRRRLLGRYRYVEHGAHYTVLVLAAVLLIGLVHDIAEFVPGLIGIGIIGASIVASLQERRRKQDASGWTGHF